MKFRNKIRRFFVILTKHSAPYWVRGSVQIVSSVQCKCQASEPSGYHESLRMSDRWAMLASTAKTTAFIS